MDYFEEYQQDLIFIWSDEEENLNLQDD